MPATEVRQDQPVTPQGDCKIPLCRYLHATRHEYDLPARLILKPSILDRITEVFTGRIYGTRLPLSDREAIGLDWRIAGNDLRHAVNQFLHEHERVDHS